MSVSKITKSPGVGSIEAPGVSLATLTYGGPQDTASATEAFVIAPGMMEMPNNPFTVALDGQVPDTGTVTWLLNDVVQQTLPYDAAYTPTMMGKITAEFVLGGEAYVTVPLHIYMHDMSDPAMSPSHMVDENAALGLVRQNVADFVAVQNGSWSDPATWSVGAVPGDGARVLIPSTRDVLYDSNTPVRLHSVRVDGLLDFALDRSTSMLVEHLVETKTGTIRIAAKANRLPPQFTCQVTISNRVFDSAPDAPSDLDFANDPRLIGRGVIWMGGGAIYGYHRAPFAKTVALNLPMMGDTSVTLGADPEGWQVGDRILIPGTLFEEINGVTQRQDETRIITAISGGVISFAEPLVYDHGWHNPALAEQNIWRLKIVNMERNVTFRSEDGANLPAHQRGHTMVMHTNQTRHWDVAFLDMGRTDKSFVTGVINANGDFEYPDPDSNAILTAPLTAQSNLQSRYPYHIHFPGFGKSVVAEAYYVYVEGVPGWGIVHHGGRANFVGCVAHRFLGAGMVSESANELGRWHDCVMVGCESTIADTQFPKGAEDKRGIQGDFAFSGYGFFYRGRDMVVTDCTAYGCTWAHVFYHR
ncbi:MAG: G8 domain-containing protein, partial [Pseudomonadota bacterium]